MSNAQDYYENYDGLSVHEYVERHVRGSAAEMDRMRKTVALLPTDVKSLLDVGAGHGVFLEELKAARAIEGVGVEITSAKVDYARSRGVDLRLGDASALDFPDRSFDALVCCEVLEHLPFGVYESALREIARVTKRWVVVTVPYDERRSFVACPYCSARVNPDYHFRSFAPGSIGGLLPGFRLLDERAMGARKRSALLDLGKRWFGQWPRFLVCPSCGFRIPSQPSNTEPAGSSVSSGGPVGAAAGLFRSLPALTRPVWLVGVFERENDHA